MKVIAQARTVPMKATAKLALPWIESVHVSLIAAGTRPLPQTMGNVSPVAHW
jgi:hypothetical protein